MNTTDRKQRGNAGHTRTQVVWLLAGIALGVTLTLAGVYTRGWFARRETARRALCGNNLKQIGLALMMYAQDYDGHFPPYDGARGLAVLLKLGYIPRPSFFICPATRTKPADGVATFSEKHCDYVYRSGFTTRSKGVGILWDKPRNHANSGHILFTDGYPRCYHGENWLNHRDP